MASNSKGGAGFWHELLAANFYKRNQGRLARQLTAVGAALIVLSGAWALAEGPLADYGPNVRYGIPFAIILVSAWVIFRLVNYPRFADFLISVEAEMDKVSWASKQELYRATMVVLSTMLFLGVVLFGFDVFWQWFFRLIGFLKF
jgi:preprotein translocase subunit SecE